MLLRQESENQYILLTVKMGVDCRLAQIDFFRSFSATRAFTIFFTRAAGSGVSNGN